MGSNLDPGKVGAILVSRGTVAVSDLMDGVRECERTNLEYTGQTLVQILVEQGSLDEEDGDAVIRELAETPDRKKSRGKKPDDPHVTPPASGPDTGMNEQPTILQSDGRSMFSGSPSEAVTTSRTRAQRILKETRAVSPDPLETSHLDAPTIIVYESAAETESLTRFEKGQSKEEGRGKDTVLSAGTGVSLVGLPDDIALVEAKEELEPNDKYLIGQELGRGGMGVVRVAKDLDLGRPVALKTLHQDRRIDETLIRALIGEARLTGQLQHPNIIPVYELGIRPSGEVFYTMKMVGTIRLYDVLRRLKAGDEDTSNEYTLLRLLNVFQRICMALHYAHSRGVVHRDVKPDNVLLGNFGEVQLMDWGIAKVLGGRTASAFTGEGVVAGTPEYMSPEQAEGADARVTHCSDIYSLGVILYEILTMTLPLEFPERRGNLKSAKAREFDPPHVRAPNRGIDVELSEICMKALSHDPAGRYEDAGEMWREIEQFLEGSKEKEQLREWATQEVEEGMAIADRYREILKEQATLQENLDEMERTGLYWSPEEQRRQVWSVRNRVSALDVVLGRTFAEAYKFFQRALGYDPKNEQARKGLSSLYDSRIEIARREQDVSHLVYFSGLRRDLWGAEAEAPGILTVRSHPEGADVYLFDSDDLAGEMTFDEDNHIGQTPIYEVEVKTGGYLLVARMDGFRDTHETVVVQSGQSDVHMLILNDWTTEMPFVERAEEIGRIRQQHQIMTGQGRFRSVVVCGPSGAGKDRILRAFDDYLIPMQQLHLYMYVAGLRASRFVPYGALSELLRHRLGVIPGDPPERVRERLEDFVAFGMMGVESRRHLSEDQFKEVHRVADRIAWMPGLGVKQVTSMDPDSNDELGPGLLQEALVELFDCLAERVPIVLILRDVDWLDYASWGLINTLRSRLSNARVLLLTTTDLSVKDVPSHSLVGYDEVIHLNPLSTSTVAHLLREVLQGPVSQELVSAIYRHTEGFAYAVEWSVRRLVYGDYLKQEDGCFLLGDGALEVLRGRFDPQAVVAERLASLEQGDRDVLDMAAIMGRTFWEDTLTAMGFKDAHLRISNLVRAEFVIRQTRGGFARGDEYRFRFDLEWQAVYAAIDPERAQKSHAAVIEWLNKFAYQDLQWLARRADHLHAAESYDGAALDCQQIGLVAARYGSYKDAARCLGRASEVAQNPRTKADALFQRIKVLITSGEMALARQDLPDMLALQPHLDDDAAKEVAQWQTKGVL